MRDSIRKECEKGNAKRKRKGETCSQYAKRLAAIIYYKRHGRTPMRDEKKAELVEDVFELVDEIAAKKEKKLPYGDVEYADPKNKKYPVDTETHIRAAWTYIHMPKNQKGYTPAQVRSIMRKIIAAWKKKIDKAGPPAAEKKAEKE